jgi:protein TonB
MNSFHKEEGAATPHSSSRFFLKKAANTKVNRLINFQLGLVVALLLVYISIEMTTLKREPVMAPVATKSIILEPAMGEYKIVENKPKVIKQKITKPVPPKTTPIKKIDISKPPVIDDSADLSFKDLMNQLTVVDRGADDPVVDLPAVSGSKNNSAPVNTNINGVMEVPLFPGCDASMNREERIDCLNQKMGRFVQRKFDAKRSGNLETGTQVRISVVFTIGTDGLPKDIQVKAPNDELAKEARRVINRLPVMVPGKNNGAAVNVTYVLPIVYNLQ